MFWPKQFMGFLGRFLLMFLLLPASVKSLIAPTEVSSLITYFRLNIPQINKGTDSRFGFGFRFGRHADVQLLIELGPQNRTRPLGMVSKRKTVKKSLPEMTVAATQQLQQLYKMATTTEKDTATEVSRETSSIN